MKLLVLIVLALALVATAYPTVWWNDYDAVDPDATVVGPAGFIHMGPSSAGEAIPGASWRIGYSWNPWAYLRALGQHVLGNLGLWE